MKRSLKILAVIILLAAAALAALVLVIKLKFPPERIKALVQEQVKIHLGRELELGGVSLGLWRGVSLRDVKLSERPGFAAGTLLSAKSVSVEPFLLPLLRGRVVIKRVALDGPTAAVIRFSDGRFNFSDLTSSTAPAAPAQGGASVPLRVNSLSVTGGNLSFDDRRGGFQAAVQDLSLQVYGFSLTDPFSARLSCGFSVAPVNKPPLAGKASFKGRLALGTETALIEDLSLAAEGVSLQAQGSVKNFSAPQADITLAVQSLKGAALAPFVDQPLLKDLAASGKLHVQGGLEQVTADGDLKFAAAGVSSHVFPLKATVKDPAGAAVFDAAVTLADLAVSKSPLIPDFSLDGGQARLTAKGDLKRLAVDMEVGLGSASFMYGILLRKLPGAQAALTAHITADAPFDRPVFELKGDIANLEIHPPSLPGLDGGCPFSFTAKGVPQDMAVTLSLDAKDAGMSYFGRSGPVSTHYFDKRKGTPLSLQAQAVVKDQKDITFSSLRLSLAGATINVSGKVADASGNPRLNLTLKAAPFDVAPLGPLFPVLRGEKLSGRLGFDLKAQGPAASPTVNGVVNLRSLGTAPMPGIAVADLTGDMGLIADSVSLSPLTGKLNGEPFSFKIFVKHFVPPELELDGSLDALDLGKLQAAFASTGTAAGGSPASSSATFPPPLARTKGSFRLGAVTHPNYVGKDFRLSWDFTRVSPDLTRVNGTMQLSAANGKIFNLPLADKVNALLKRDAADITYSKLGGRMTVVNGLLSTQDFTIDSRQMDIAAKGTVNLADTQADLRAVFKLAPGAVGGSIESYFADDQGRVTVEATIKGPLANPTIRPDLSKAASQAAKKTVESFLKKALEKNAGTPADPNAPAADPNKELEDAAKKALRGLFKKKK